MLPRSHPVFTSVTQWGRRCPVASTSQLSSTSKSRWAAEPIKSAVCTQVRSPAARTIAHCEVTRRWSMTTEKYRGLLCAIDAPRCCPCHRGWPQQQGIAQWSRRGHTVYRSAVTCSSFHVVWRRLLAVAWGGVIQGRISVSQILCEIFCAICSVFFRICTGIRQAVPLLACTMPKGLINDY